MIDRPEWIAVDWGTSHLRVWAMGADGTPLAARRSGAGMAGLAREAFAPTLAAEIAAWVDPGHQIDVIACGMVGSRQGWLEAPYLPVPAALSALGPALVQVSNAPMGARVWIVPGLMQRAPANVMRGEETQAAGLLAREPGFDGLLCLPGTHSKWAHLSAGRIDSFSTVMTGEVFATLAHHSILRHSVSEGAWDADAFDQAVADALADPVSVPAKLFSVRAAGLVGSQTTAQATSRLSGLLIGQDLATRSDDASAGLPVALVAASGLADLYARALALQGRPVTRHDGETLVLSGLSALRSAARAAGTFTRALPEMTG